MQMDESLSDGVSVGIDAQMHQNSLTHARIGQAVLADCILVVVIANYILVVLRILVDCLLVGTAESCW